MNIRIVTEHILHILFPSRPDIAAVESLSPESFLSRVSLSDKLLPEYIYALFIYKEPLVRHVIWTLKYKGNRILCRLCATLIYDNLIEILADKLLFSHFSDPILIPLPSSKERLKERGWNQTYMLARELEQLDRNRSFEIRKDIIEKIKHTKAQAKLSERERRINLKNSFTVKPEKVQEIKGRNIILLDDVITTGSTFLEVMRTLKIAGAGEIICIAVAH